MRKHPGEQESHVPDHELYRICQNLHIWGYRLGVRTADFHSVNRSSILRSPTKFVTLINFSNAIEKFKLKKTTLVSRVVFLIIIIIIAV